MPFRFRNSARPPGPDAQRPRGALRFLIGGLVGMAALIGGGLLVQFARTPDPPPMATAIPTLLPIAAQSTTTPTATPTATPLAPPSPTTAATVATLAARAAEILILVPTEPPTDTLAVMLPTVTATPAGAVELVATQPPAPATPIASAPRLTVNSAINVRRGPSTDYAILGNSSAAQQYAVTGRDASGTWWAIDFHGQTGWVFGELVTASGVEAVPVVDSPVLSAPAVAAPVQAEPVLAEPLAVEQNQTRQSAETNPNAFTCAGGCATPPDPSCDIKGNVNNEGDRIYHTPSSNWYTRTDIKPEEGDRWFCTTAEADAAGFRAPRN